MVALCVWLAPVWLTILLTVLVVLGMIAGWIVEDVRAAGKTAAPDAHRSPQE